MKSNYTTDHSLFDMPARNRPLYEYKLKELEVSMTTHGFNKRKPLCVEAIEGGRFRIIDGRHRFTTAKKLGIGLWYEIDVL